MSVKIVVNHILISHISRQSYAFGSIAAIFHHLSSEDVGCGYGYLRRAGLSGGGTVVTKKAIIQQTTLLTAPRNNNPAME
ncbi:MAG: hypothetical protein K2M13_01840 [Muribaculaceae bacterium]|nr:hypothetical protein [Muribaculaceae bacterium]